MNYYLILRIYKDYIKNSKKNYFICHCSKHFNYLWYNKNYKIYLRNEASKFLELKQKRYNEDFYILNTTDDVLFFNYNKKNSIFEEKYINGNIEIRKSFLEYLLQIEKNKKLNIFQKIYFII